MYPDEYKAASERTDEAERGLCRPFRRVKVDEAEQRDAFASYCRENGIMTDEGIETLGDMARALGVPLAMNADEAQEADDERLVEWGAESEPYNHDEAQARKEAWRDID